jgi:molecular chaperone HtpG
MFCNNLLFSKHSSYNDGTSLLLNHFPPRTGQPSQSVLYSVSGERFENKVQLNWPKTFNEDDHLGFYIFGPVSVNGVLCLYKTNEKVVLWNPVVKEFKVIPRSPFGYETPYRIPNFHIHGFGYDRVKDDYKVIRQILFFRLSSFDEGWRKVPKGISYNSIWDIYSLRSNSWRKLDIDMPGCFPTNTGVKLYMDGVCHWWGNNEIDKQDYLVSFDLSNESFITTPIVLNIHSGFHIRRLTVLNESIAWITNYEKTNTFHISILGKVGVKESWIKLMIIEPLSFVEHHIGVGKNGDIFFSKENGEYVSFNLRTQMIVEFGIKDQSNQSQLVIYEENPLSTGRIGT